MYISRYIFVDSTLISSGTRVDPRMVAATPEWWQRPPNGGSDPRKAAATPRKAAATPEWWQRPPNKRIVNMYVHIYR